MGSEDDSGDDYGHENEDDEEDYDNGMGDLPSHPAMKRELVQAIEDERREY